MSRDIAPFGLRMADDLKARVHAAAAANGRSMNAEILSVLMREYPAPPSDAEQQIADLKAEVARLRAALEAHPAPEAV